MIKRDDLCRMHTASGLYLIQLQLMRSLMMTHSDNHYATVSPRYRLTSNGNQSISSQRARSKLKSGFGEAGSVANQVRSQPASQSARFATSQVTIIRRRMLRNTHVLRNVWRVCISSHNCATRNVLRHTLCVRCYATHSRGIM